MKILAIIGSPRKGNSYRITRQVEERMKLIGQVEFDYVFLKDVEIKPCQGCFLCTSKGEKYCPIKDGCPEVLARMQEADGVIFVSPVYALSVTGLMKNFKDRLAYNVHRPQFFGKYAMSIVTSAGTGLNGTLKYLSTFSIWGFEFVSQLGIINYPYLKPTPHLQKQTTDSIDTASKKFYQAIETKKQRSPSLIKVLQFRVLKCNTVVAKEYWQADYEFYKDRQGYYYETKIATYKKFFAWLFEKMYMGYMQKNYVLNH